MKIAVFLFAAGMAFQVRAGARAPLPPAGNAAFNVIHYVQEGVRVFDDGGKPGCFHFSYLFENPRDVYIPLHDDEGGYKQGIWNSEITEEGRQGRFGIEVRRSGSGRSVLTARVRLEGGAEQSFRLELAAGEEASFRRRTLTSVAPDCTRALLTVGPVAGP